MSGLACERSSEKPLGEPRERGGLEELELVEPKTPNRESQEALQGGLLLVMVMRDGITTTTRGDTMDVAQ